MLTSVIETLRCIFHLDLTAVQRDVVTIPTLSRIRFYKEKRKLY